MRNLTSAFAVCGLLILSSISASMAQKYQIGIDAGPSKVIARGIDELKIGISFDGDFFYGLNDYFLIGLRAGHIRWASARDFLAEAIANISNIDVSGTPWSLEIIPSARATTKFPNNVVNLFAQAGAGLYIIKSKTEISGLVPDSTGGLRPVSRTFGTDARAHFGFSAGVGATIGQPTPVMIQVYPLYNYVFRDISPNQYFTINAGLVFGF